MGAGKFFLAVTGGMVLNRKGCHGRYERKERQKKKEKKERKKKKNDI